MFKQDNIDNKDNNLEVIIYNIATIRKSKAKNKKQKNLVRVLKKKVVEEKKIVVPKYIYLRNYR